MTHTFISLKTVLQETVKTYGCLKSRKSEITPTVNQPTSLKGMGWLPFPELHHFGSSHLIKTDVHLVLISFHQQ